MKQLEKSLNDWVSQQLITSEQAKKISEYEDGKPGSSWVLYGFLILGALIIGIGIISIIAANWNDIPDGVKLFFDFALLAGLAFGAYKAWENDKNILFEVLLVSFIIHCLASIGLISQIYHTGGKLYQALLLWSFITVGVAAASKNAFIPFIWTGGLLSGILFTALNSPLFQPIFHKNGAPVALMLPFICALLAILSRTWAGDSGQTKAFRAWAVLSGLVGLFVSEARVWRFFMDDLTVSGFMPAYFFAGLCALSVGNSSEYNKAQKILLLLTIGLFILPFHFMFWELKSSLLFAIFTIAILSCLSLFLASLHHRRLFNLLLVLLGIRFLVLYFQAFGGLAYTGFGLIFSGLIIIAMVVAWNKYRKKITTWAEGLIN